MTIPRNVLFTASRSDTIQDLMGRLNHQYSRLDHLWKDVGMESLVAPTRKCLTPRHAIREEMKITYIDRVYVPFDAKVVDRATWGYLQDPCLWRPFAGDIKVRSP